MGVVQVKSRGSLCDTENDPDLPSRFTARGPFKTLVLRGDSTTPPTMRSIVQNRFACSWKNVAINRRL